MLRFFIESNKKLIGDFSADLHAIIKHTKPFALKARKSLVVEQNVHTKQDERLLERKCQTTIIFCNMCTHILLDSSTKKFFSSPVVLSLYLLSNGTAHESQSYE
jgi:hypothetical protein